MSDAPDITIGPFVLGEPLGKGGMGVVFRAEHVKTRLPVAMKFLSAYERHGTLRAAFRREVQLVAGLDHPGIVRVLDYGAVSDGEAPAGSAFATGDPWLAMELAKHGSFDAVMAESWDDLRWVLLSVLDALAHAHARGVVHRDLKPGNILIAEEAGRRVVRLADFGIAHLRRETGGFTKVDGSSHESAGTPHYMAPEQIRGDWRNFGAWTDLYALGCVAYRLATGMHVFGGDTAWVIWDQHMSAPPPPLRRLNFEVPPGFEPWVQRLLAKHSRDRFRRAADAAWVLRNMVAPDAPVLRISTPVEAGSATMTLRDIGLEAADFSMALGVTLTAQGQTAPMEELLVDAPSPIGGHVEVVAPMPQSWRMPERQTAAAAYFDVGLGLFGMRSVPMIGRERERDILWSALSEVRTTRKSRVVVLEGEPGRGKTALAQWICERAHEVGGASVIRVLHDAEAGASTGLLAAIDRYTDCEGLSREATWVRLREMMAGRCREPALRAAALTELLRPSNGAPDIVPPVVFSSALERSIALRDALAAIVGGRPLLLWLDDAHLPSAVESLDAVRALLRDDSNLGALVLVTARPDSSPEGLLAGFEGDRLVLNAVSRDELLQMIRAVLPVSERAAIVVCDRSEGVPSFAFQLLADWVQSGKIVARDRGFEVDDLDAGGLPADITALWQTRVRTFLATTPEREASNTALGVAAVLGRNVLQSEFDAACQRLDATIPHTLIDGLVRAGLATPRRDGFSFAHAMLAEVVASDLSDEQTRQMHAACAEVVDDDSRIARHFSRSGDHARAIEYALRAVADSWADDRAASAGRLLTMAEGAAEMLGLSESDPRVVQMRLWRIRGFRVRWDFDEVRVRARALVVTTASDALALQRAEALVELGLAEGYSGGELEKAAPHFTAAASIFERLAETKSLAEVLSRLCYVRVHMGELAEGVKLGERCVELYRTLDEPDGLARGLVAYGHALNEADDDRVLAIFEEAAELAADAGLRYWQANVLYGLATFDEQAGRHSEAISRLRLSAQTCAEIGSTAVDACRVNLACLLVLTGEWEEATGILQEIEQRGTLAQLWKRARYALLAIAKRGGDAEREARLRAEILGEPVDDPTTRALFALAK